jgi:hypothetical protein
MSYSMRYILGLAAGALILVTASAQPASAQQATPFRPKVPSGTFRPKPLPVIQPVYPHDKGMRPIGGDWWRTYPWSPYNAWKNPYWYPPYNTNYPYPPDQAYPYNPYPDNPYPAPQPLPPPLPWGGIGSSYK